MPMHGARYAALLGTIVLLVGCGLAQHARTPGSGDTDSHGAQTPVERGRYLAKIGVCSACHTPPNVGATPPAPGDLAALARERRFRTDPDWVLYLDLAGNGEQHLSGGVPFWLRFVDPQTNAVEGGVVYTRNITPDVATGIGSWSEDDIVKALRTGVRKDGTNLFLFAPHTFYKNLTEEDARALAAYLKSLPPVSNEVGARSIPEIVQRLPYLATTLQPMTPRPSSELPQTPAGRNPQRAMYLTTSLVGCMECHSHHDASGREIAFAGGDPHDPLSTFRLGPDLPLRQNDRGLSTFPYPGYATLVGPNLTRFGVGGDWHDVSTDAIVTAIRRGISTQPDPYGRPDPLEHVMMWQFYASMSDDDAYAIADYLKSLTYVKHDVEPTLTYYGSDWAAAFQAIYGAAPTEADRAIFGK
jgi:cytochrome c553